LYESGDTQRQFFHVNEQHIQHYYNTYRTAVEQRIKSLSRKKNPASVYEPIRYILNSGGKRLRAILVMLSCETVSGSARRALDAAVAIEMLHNFTLVHDDVMDHATLRRGKPTIQKKWDENVAILSGDEMIALAYQALVTTATTKPLDIVRSFTAAFIEVCEGQGLDKEYETRTDVNVKDYLVMIRKKTACMISAACEIGGIIGEGTRADIAALRSFGEHLGIAFQMKDDLLDITGEEKDFGKAIGSDVIERKKTFLLLTALDRARGEDKSFLKAIMSPNSRRTVDVRRVRKIYERAGVLDIAEATIRRRTATAQRALTRLPSSRAKQMLVWLSGKLLERNH
jgi:geranylgeranyl diphosphate synthase type II